MAISLGVDLTANTAKFTEGINKAGGSLKNFEGIAKTAGAAIMTHLSFGALKGMAEMGAKAMQAEEAFRNTAKSIGISAAKWEADLKRAANSTVDSSDMMQAAMKGVTGGMKQEDTVRLMEAARMGARRMGNDVSEAYKDIINAVEMQREKSLRAYGLITKAQSDMIKEIKAAGIEVDLMTVIMGNYENWAIKMGEATENANEKFQQSKAIIKDVQESIGIGIILTLADAITTLKTFAKSWKIMWDDIKIATGFGEQPTNQGLLSLVGGGVTGAGKGDKAKIGDPNAYLKGLMGKIPGKEVKGTVDVIQKVIDNLKFELEQLSRTDEEQKIYNSLKQAGVEINSEFGQTIAAIASQIYKVTEAMKVEEELLKRLMDGEEAMYDAWTKDEEARLKAIKYFNDNLRMFAESEADAMLAQIEASEALAQQYQKMWEDAHPYIMMMNDAWEEMVLTLESTLSASLFAVMTGQLSSFKDIFSNFCNSILKTFTDMVAEMIVNGH